MASPRIGAYLLAADPTWLRSTVARYYDRLDALVVAAASDGLGWTGHPIPVEECLDVIREIDTRGIADVVRDVWRSPDNPMQADTAQRQAALDVLKGRVDWALQLDTDELLPDVPSLLQVLQGAGDVVAVEWPMRVLYRRLRNGRYLQVVSTGGQPRYEYPGPIAIRPESRLAVARRTEGPFLRLMVEFDRESAEARRPPETGEVRAATLVDRQAIIHNSWARSPADVHRKVSSWSHNAGLRTQLYYYAKWLPAPLRWRWMRDFHPMHRDLWPRLGAFDVDPSWLHPADR